MRQSEMKKILEIGVLLSAERDLDRLLEHSLRCVMELANCDGGTLYLLEGGALRFKHMCSHSMGTFQWDPDLPPVPMERENVCAMALLEGRTVLIDDVYNSKDYDFSGPVRYDALNGYRTRSMLAVPMVSREGERIGVLQLINALDDRGEVCPFSPEMALVMESIASQAAITIQNVRYISQIKALFHSLVRLLSDAIDERTPYNASHTRHMAEYGARFLDFLNARAVDRGEAPPFDAARREELLMSVWLHDIGKLATPLAVMNKFSRLLPEQQTAVRHRLEVIRLRGEIDLLSGRLSREEYDALQRQVREAGALVEEADKSGLWAPEKRDALDALAARTYTDGAGKTHPWLEPEEYNMLSIRRGTLSDEERKIMERHVVLTDRFLSEIEFSPDLSHVHRWAASHHELLDGTGYPAHITAEDIPTEVRILTILDIFEALVADDRPYKPGKPAAQALDILRDMAHGGKLDRELVELFAASRCWEDTSGTAEEECIDPFESKT